MFIFQSYNWGEKPSQKKENVGKSLDDLPGSVPARSHSRGSVGESWGKEENHQAEVAPRSTRRESVGYSWGENCESTEESGMDSRRSINSSWGRIQKTPQGDEVEQQRSDRGWGRVKGEKKEGDGMQGAASTQDAKITQDAADAHEIEAGEKLPSSTPDEVEPASMRRNAALGAEQENKGETASEETKNATAKPTTTSPAESETETPEASETETTEVSDTGNSSVTNAPTSGLSRFIYSEDEENTANGGSLESGETTISSSQDDDSAPIPPPMSLRGRGKRIDDFERAILADHAFSYNFKA